MPENFAFLLRAARPGTPPGGGPCCAHPGAYPPALRRLGNAIRPALDSALDSLVAWTWATWTCLDLGLGACGLLGLVGWEWEWGWWPVASGGSGSGRETLRSAWEWSGPRPGGLALARPRDSWGTGVRGAGLAFQRVCLRTPHRTYAAPATFTAQHERGCGKKIRDA
jgi:hypothetical protein